MVGRHEVVRYDSKLYPGVATDFDDNELRVNVMHKIGPNSQHKKSLEEHNGGKKVMLKQCEFFQNKLRIRATLTP